MTTYQPRFPRCVDGNNYRHPRKAPEFETVSLEMDRIYSTASLSNVERAHLLEIHFHLARAESYSVSGLPGAEAASLKWTLPVVLAEFAEFQRRNGLAVAGDADDDI